MQETTIPENGSTPASVPPLVTSLVRAFETGGIAYCHWKSNIALERSVAALSDLDLLVRRAHAGRFVEALSSLGFKEARPPRGQELPGVLHYYGYDVEAARLVHVHAHYQIVVGHDRTKGYRVPVEEAYLDFAAPRGLLRVPPPELEWIVFVLRMVLKFGPWEAVLGGQGRLPANSRAEFEDLRGRVDRAAVERHRAALLPCVDAGLFESCVESLRRDASPWLRIRTAARLHRALRSLARRSRPADVGLKLSRRVERTLRRRLRGGVPKMRLTSGGATIALVGGDGAGKSTAIEGLHAWLSKDLDVRRVHLGRPKRSITTRAVRAMLKVARAVHASFAPRRGAGAGQDDSPGLPDYQRMLWSVCASRDRRRAYRSARRFAANGGVVICDRFPIPGIRLMDAPGVERILGGRRPSGTVRLLAAMELRWYREMVLPELLFVLKVHPDEAVRRKIEERPEQVRARSREIWEFDWSATPAVVVDASAPREEVLARLKSAIWTSI